MLVNYKIDGLWKTENLTQCAKCGGAIIPNKYKKEDKHPDFKCDNASKTADGNYECGMGFWKPKEKPQQPITQPTETASLLRAILATLIEIRDK